MQNVTSKLSNADVAELRGKNLLARDEIAVLEGDVLLAENVITRARRVIDRAGLILECDRKLITG